MQSPLEAKFVDFENEKTLNIEFKTLNKKSMFIRIVKMSFAEENVDAFLENFHNNKEKIRAVDGCEFLQLLRDKDNTNIFFTYSFWNRQEDLDNYRHSELFKNVWAKTKVLFNDKPEAWSVEKVVTLD